MATQLQNFLQRVLGGFIGRFDTLGFLDQIYFEEVADEIVFTILQWSSPRLQDARVALICILLLVMSSLVLLVENWICLTERLYEDEGCE